MTLQRGQRFLGVHSSVQSLFKIAILLCYLLVMALFSDWRYTFVIWIKVPVGLVGGLIGLAALFGAGAVFAAACIGSLSQPLDIITTPGFLILLMPLLITRSWLWIGRRLPEARWKAGSDPS